MSGNKKVDFNDSVPAPPTDMVNIHFQKETIDADNAKISAYVDPADLPSGGGGGGASSFDELAGGTNTTAAMVVGTGAHLTHSGSGEIDATEVQGVPISGGPPTLGQLPIGQGDGSAAWADPFVQGVYNPDTNVTTGGVSGGPIKPVLIGGKGADGTLKDISTANDGSVNVNVISNVGAGGLTDTQLRASPVPVSGPLTDTQLRASAVPVSAAALPLPSGAATAAKQDAEKASIDAISSQLPTALVGGKLSVTDPTALPLPSGAATAANQDTANASLSSIDGKLANPMPVTDNNGSLTTDIPTNATLEVPFTTTTAQAVGSTDAQGYRGVSIHITSQGGSSTVTFQGSNDNTNWVSIPLQPTAGTAPSVNTTQSGIILVGPLPTRYFRLNVTGIASGTTAGVMEFLTFAPGTTYVGVSSAGSNLTTNVAQINGVTPLMGAGNTGTGSPRVTVASDQAAIAVKNTPQTSGGCSFASGSIGATATAIKASAGQLFLLDVFNQNTAMVYAQIFNKTTANVTLGTTVPDMSVGIPAGGGKVIALDSGIAFGTAISIAITTTRTGNTGPSSTVDYNAAFA